MTDTILNRPLESSPKTKFSRSLFQISQSTNHGPHELNVRRAKKVHIELEPNKEITSSLFRINEELLGQMKQMQYQMMKMNGAAGPDNGTSERKRIFIFDVCFKVWEAPQMVVRQCPQWAAEGKPESCKLCNVQQSK